LRKDQTINARLDLTDSTPLPLHFQGCSLAVGNFDGVHIGHQALIVKSESSGRSLGALPLALTFDPHPREVLQPNAPFFQLLDPSARRRLLMIAGARRVVEIEFTPAVAELSPEAFVEDILVQRLKPKAVSVGEGFRFGRRRTGDTALLTALGLRFGFTVEVLPTVNDEADCLVSSGRVRDALRDGDVVGANAVLGYRWFISGTVVTGDKRGRELGYPTANIRIPVESDIRHGIYVVAVSWDGQTPLPGIANFGIRPMFGGGEPLLEVHLFDRTDDLYGRELTVSFFAWLRPEDTFESIDLLIQQMDADSLQARAILAAADSGSWIDGAMLRDY
jgi:riboflavin kinase/FMN adenylyltransferase